MALTEENGAGMVMPVSPMGSANGGFGNGYESWIILFLIFGLMGNGGWGNGYGGMNAQLGYDFPWLLHGQNKTDTLVSNGFQNAQLANQLTGIQGAVTSGFGDVQTALCGGFAGVNASVNNAQNAIAQQMYAGQIADLERSFAAQTANTAGLTNLSAQMANCCCAQSANTADLKYTIANEACATRNSDTQNTQALMNTFNTGLQSIKDQLCADKIESKNDIIAQLRSELMFARGQASQDVQTAAIQAGQRALANEVEQYVAPRAIPSYTVASPYCCNQNYTYACGMG